MTTTTKRDITRPFTSLSDKANDYVVALIIAAVLTVATYLLATAVGWVDLGSVNFLEVLAAGINYGCTYLSIRQRRAFYLLGVGASGLYILVYGASGLLGSAVLSGYLTITLIYGFFRWGSDNNTRPVHHLSWKWLPVYILVTAAIYVGAVFVIGLFGGAFAFWDAAILVLTILAQLMLDQKVMQTWIVWTLVNIVGTIVYFQIGLYFAAMQQVLFGLANFYGWYQWRKSLKATDGELK